MKTSSTDHAIQSFSKNNQSKLHGFNDGDAKFIAIPKELYPFISILLIG